MRCSNLHFKKDKIIKFEPTWDWLEPSLESLQRIHVKLTGVIMKNYMLIFVASCTLSFWNKSPYFYLVRPLIFKKFSAFTVKNIINFEKPCCFEFIFKILIWKPKKSPIFSMYFYDLKLDFENSIQPLHGISKVRRQKSWNVNPFFSKILAVWMIS